MFNDTQSSTIPVVRSPRLVLSNTRLLSNTNPVVGQASTLLLFSLTPYDLGLSDILYQSKKFIMEHQLIRLTSHILCVFSPWRHYTYWFAKTKDIIHTYLQRLKTLYILICKDWRHYTYLFAKTEDIIHTYLQRLKTLYLLICKLHTQCFHRIQYQDLPPFLSCCACFHGTKTKDKHILKSICW